VANFSRFKTPVWIILSWRRTLIKQLKRLSNLPKLRDLRNACSTILAFLSTFAVVEKLGVSWTPLWALLCFSLIEYPRFSSWYIWIIILSR
jgi:hypothetical protein